MKVYLNKEYKCVKVEDNTFVANDSSNYIRYYFVTNANGDVIDKMDDTSVIYKNTEPSYVTVAFRRADGDVIQHLMASPTTDSSGVSYFEYIITDTDGVLYKKGALEISAQFIDATISEKDGVKKVISQRVKAIAINTAHVLDNIGEEAEEYYSQYEQANNEAHAVLQSQITKNFNNIGTLQDLTTENKDDLVKAINEVDAHADANKANIGDLTALTTDEKTTIVGAINEVDEHANTAQQTADNAKELANTGISKAEQAQATANTAVNTANEAKTKAQTAENNANSAVDKADNAIDRANKAYEKAANNVYAVGFMTLEEAITAVNGYDNTVLKTNDNILVVAQGSPDLYVTSVEATSVPYNFTTVDDFNDDLVKNTVLQIGYYKVAFYETDGQPVTVAWQNVVVNNWVASTEFADFPYEAKINLTDFVDYKTVPQVVFDIADTMSGNYAPICKSGDKCVYIYSKVNTAITLKTVITFAPNVNGASVTGGGYTNKGKWVASTTYEIDDLVYTDKGQYVCIEGITSTTPPDNDTTHWQASFVATAGTTENGLKFTGQNSDGTNVQKTFDGSAAVEVSFDETTMTTKEVDGVLKVGAKGTIPEALPQTAGALKSGSLPTSGWENEVKSADLWNGSVTVSSFGGSPAYEVPAAVEQDLKNIVYSHTGQLYLYTDDGKEFICVYDSASSSSSSIVYLGINNGIKIGISTHKDASPLTISVWNQSKTSQTVVAMSTYKLVSGKKLYTISDTDVTVNSDVLMELTDEGMVKAYALANGSIQVIRDRVPTIAIPYTYKVKQTNASGQFTLVNHFVPNVPVTSVNGQTGAVTIAVPTKTSELTNDSNFATKTDIPTKTSQLTNDSNFATKTDIPIKTSQLTNDSGFITAADIPGAGEWVTVTGETAVLTQAGTYQVIASDMQSIVYWDGSKVGQGASSTRAYVVGESAFLHITIVYPSIDASGTLSILVITVSDSTGKWVESTSKQSGFKYRKIN